jgi:hypothetical protein
MAESYDRFYGEWAPYSNKVDKIYAEQYLLLWEKVLLNKLKDNVIFVDRTLIDQPPLGEPPDAKEGRVAIKVYVRNI